MNTYQAQPHGRFSSNSTLVVTPNIQPELKKFQDKVEGKVDNSLDDYNKRLTELEELYKSLANRTATIAPLDRDKAQILHPKDLIRRQTKNGYFEIPYDCYLEGCIWGYNTAYWINVPYDDPNKVVQDYFNNGLGARNNWWPIIAAMNKWKFLECSSSHYAVYNSTIASKGDHVVLSWGFYIYGNQNVGHTYGYWKPLDDTKQTGNINHWGSDVSGENSLSYIKMIPFK